jgi:hypothetical protein
VNQLPKSVVHNVASAFMWRSAFATASVPAADGELPSANSRFGFGDEEPI